ncbi:YhjD/YihY/BrkB family envelope integrity protein [Pseudonocardia sp. NPDC049635]|uniref:YihY/virulence factor BrkB family protein n=1 Tax=Pseudonocardia sp. NPDC049635 TaxID=3155506 RepID=UPI0033DA228D
MRVDIGHGVARLRSLPERSAPIGHARRAVDRYRLQRGNHLSAAVAFYTVIAAVPLAMVSFTALGLLVFWRTTSPDDLVLAVRTAFPPGLMSAVEPVLETAADRRGSLVGIGLLGALWAGTTWTSYLREALSAQFGLPAVRMVSPRRVLWDLWALVVLGAAVLGSIGVTLAVTGLAGLTLELFGLRDAIGGRIALRVVGAVLVLAVDTAVLCFVLARLPRRPVPLRRVLRPAAVGAVALELLKLGTALAVGAVSDTAGGAVFGTVLATLFFLFAMSRLLVMLAAWVATDGADGQAAAPPGRVGVERDGVALPGPTGPAADDGARLR